MKLYGAGLGTRRVGASAGRGGEPCGPGAPWPGRPGATTRAGRMPPVASREALPDGSRAGPWRGRGAASRTNPPAEPGSGRTRTNRRPEPGGPVRHRPIEPTGRLPSARPVRRTRPRASPDRPPAGETGRTTRRTGVRAAWPRPGSPARTRVRRRTGRRSHGPAPDRRGSLPRRPGRQAHDRGRVPARCRSTARLARRPVRPTGRAGPVAGPRSRTGHVGPAGAGRRGRTGPWGTTRPAGGTAPRGARRLPRCRGPGTRRWRGG